MHGKNEESWVQLVQSTTCGEGEAFSTIHRRLRPRLERLIRAWRFPPETTDDLLQDTFERLFVSLPRLRDAEALPSWAAAICRNACRDEARRVAGEKFRFVEMPQNAATAVVTMYPDAFTVETRLALARRLILEHPHADRRRVAVAFYLEGSSAAAIARRFDMALGTVLSHLHRFRKNITGGWRIDIEALDWE